MAMGIPARIFATLLRFSPGRMRNWMWKWWYQRLAKAHNRSDFRFMNYGFIDGDGPELDDEDMLEGYDFYNDIELYEFKGHFKEFGPEFEFFDYSGTCRDCYFTKPLNLKVIKRPTLKSYNLTKKSLF